MPEIVPNMSELTKNFFLQSGEHRSSDLNHQFFIFMSNRGSLELLLFAQCVIQYQENPGKRKGTFINDWFLTFESDKIPEKLRSIVGDLNLGTVNDMANRLAAAQKNIATIQGIGTTFSDKAHQHGFFRALKLIVSRDTKPPADMFNEYQKAIMGVIGWQLEKFDPTRKYKIASHMPEKIIDLKKCLKEATFNPDHMGIR